ncbi:MAG: hypothetical protein AAFN30_17715, partial [Actinomycetota bacterium]
MARLTAPTAYIGWLPIGNEWGLVSSEGVIGQHGPNQLMYAVGAVKRAIEDGCTSMNAVIIDGAQIFVPPMENAIAALGQSFGEIIILPP